MTAFARTPVLPVATAVGALSAQCDVRRGDPECPVNVDIVENVWPAPSARGFAEIGG